MFSVEFERKNIREAKFKVAKEMKEMTKVLGTLKLSLGIGEDVG